MQLQRLELLGYLVSSHVENLVFYGA